MKIENHLMEFNCVCRLDTKNLFNHMPKKHFRCCRGLILMPQTQGEEKLNGKKQNVFVKCIHTQFFPRFFHVECLSESYIPQRCSVRICEQVRNSKNNSLEGYISLKS